MSDVNETAEAAQKRKVVEEENNNLLRRALQDAGIQLHSLTLERNFLRERLCVQGAELASAKGVIRYAAAQRPASDPLVRFLALTDSVAPVPAGEVV